jgi:hypothetical protein
MVEKDSVVARFGRMLMLADKQEDGSGASPREPDKTYNAKDFVVAARALNEPRTSRRTKGPPLEPRWQDDRHPAYGISLTCRWAGREGVQPSKPSIALQPMVEFKQVVEKCPKRE